MDEGTRQAIEHLVTQLKQTLAERDEERVREGVLLGLEPLRARSEESSRLLMALAKRLEAQNRSLQSLLAEVSSVFGAKGGTPDTQGGVEARLERMETGLGQRVETLATAMEAVRRFMGESARQMEETSAGLDRLGRAIREVRDGGSETLDPLKARLEELVRSLEGLNDRFGEQGQELTTIAGVLAGVRSTTEKLPQGLKDLQARLEREEGAGERLDALLVGMEEVRSWTLDGRMSLSAEDLEEVRKAGNRAVEAVTPLREPLERMDRSLEELRGLGPSVQAVPQTVAKAVAPVLDRVEEGNRTLETLAGGMSKQGKALGAVAKDLTRVSGDTEHLSEKVEDLIADVERTEKNLAERMEKLAGSWNAVRSATEGVPQSLADLQSKLDRLEKGFQESARRTEAFMAERKRWSAVVTVLVALGLAAGSFSLLLGLGVLSSPL